MLNSMNNYVANSLVLSMLQASGHCVARGFGLPASYYYEQT